MLAMKVLLVRPLLLNMLTLSGTIDCEPLELEYLYTACREIGVEAVLYLSLIHISPGAIPVFLPVEKERCKA